MHKLYSELIGMSVFDEYTNSALALINDIVIDPDTGKVLAFIVKNNHIIVPLDVLRIARGLFIADKSHILPLDEVQRVANVLQKYIKIIGARVITERDKLYIGKTVDYEIDTTHMVLNAIYAAKTFFFFRFHERIISYRSIVEIKKETIIVKDIRETSAREKVPAQSSAFA